MTPRIVLREGRVTELALPASVAAELTRLDVASVTPMAGDGIWRVERIRRVGVLRVTGHEIAIEPKVPVERLFFLLSEHEDGATWRDDDVALDAIDQLYPAIAHSFLRQTERALAGGLLRDYASVRVAEPAIRGRFLVTEQLSRRRGLALPAELLVDEYTADIAENRMLRSAARIISRMPALSTDARARATRIDALLDGVTVLTAGVPLPHIRPSRRNARLAPALHLARLILERGSLSHTGFEVLSNGFLLTMSTVFERFVEVEAQRAAREMDAVVVAQHRTSLDRDGGVSIRPDLVLMEQDEIRAVFDAKYKYESPAGYPNADIYQMLAYCIRLGLEVGHLIYAAGDATPARYVVEQSGVTIVCHALALDRPDADIRAQIAAIIGSRVEHVE